jgi:hypothetical protein
MNADRSSNKLRDGSIHCGAELDEPATVLIKREQFVKSTYLKVVLSANGDWVVSNAPVTVILGDKWRWWKLGDTKLIIAYDPDATETNKWWQTNMKEYMSRRRMFGDLVVMRWHWDVGLPWEDVECKIRLYLFEKYKEREGFSPLLQHE